MVTESEPRGYSREECLDGAAEVLARIWAERATASPTEVREAV